MEPFVSVLIVALYNTLSLCKLLYVSQCFSRPFSFKHSRAKKVPFLETPQSLRAVQYQSSPGSPTPGIGQSKYCIPQSFSRCCCCFFKIIFIWLQHFLLQYLHLHGGKIKTTYKREKKIQCYSIYN